MKNFWLGLLLFSCVAKAQIWCPPNAEWFHTRYYLGGSSYSKVTYVGTVTINSYTCQQLNYFAETYSQMTNTTTTFTVSPYYTYTTNGVVFLNKKNTNSFDTLYHFNAVPNDVWLLPASYVNTTVATCARSKLTVLDTGHQIIQSINLRWLKVQLSNGFPQTDTIFERIGFLKNYFLQYDYCTGQLDYNEGGPLRCYSDNQITNYKKVAYGCNFLNTPSALTEFNLTSKQNLFRIWPSPSSTKLNFELLNSTDKFSDISIINNFGQVVSEYRQLSADTREIPIDNLADGTYFLIVQTSSGRQTRKLIILH